LANYNRTPIKPTLDGEPNYEDIPVGFNQKNGWFTAFDARQAAYWSMLAGAMGHTYGNNNIWQMWQPGRDPIIDARTPWYEAIDYPGAFQMQFMKQLFLAFPFYKMHPEQNLIAGDILRHSTPARAALANDNSFALIYIPHGQNIGVNLSAFQNEKVDAYWYNPRLGTHITMKSFTADGNRNFNPPSDRKRGNDWVLIIKKSGSDYSLP